MAKGLFYAVRKGANIGVFSSWAECFASVSGYSGADFQKFKSYEEALMYVEKGATGFSVSDKPVVYLGGKYYPDKLQSAAILKYSNSCIDVIRYSTDNKWIDVGVCGAYIMGFLSLNEILREKGYKDIVVRTNYEGLSMWWSGFWSANNIASQALVRFKRTSGLTVTFEAVTSLTKDFYSDRLKDLLKSSAPSCVFDVSFLSSNYA